jgi:hypothetical protein
MSNEIARQEYIEGLRQLADLLEATPDLPAPRMEYNSARWSAWSNAAEVARLASLVPGQMHKNDPNANDYNAEYYELTSSVQFGPFRLIVQSYRTTVCERVQTGTKRTMIEAVKAAPARFEDVPVFEYVCSPLLAKAVAS